MTSVGRTAGYSLLETGTLVDFAGRAALVNKGGRSGSA
jgi:hypothetical protein